MSVDLVELLVCWADLYRAERNLGEIEAVDGSDATVVCLTGIA